jgi:hypothetical protein
MKFLAIPVFLALFSLASCKKEYTCQCSNSFSTYDAGTVEMTKAQAKKHCKSLSAGETSCKLK